jgi:hypothetical protein
LFHATLPGSQRTDYQHQLAPNVADSAPLRGKCPVVWWEVPFTKVTCQFLEKYLPGLVEWTFPVPQNLPEKLEFQTPNFFRIEKQCPPAKYELAVTKLEETMMVKRYSHRTVKLYKFCFRQFILFYNDLKPSQLTRAQIDAFLLHLVRDKKISESHQNVYECAIKLF